MASKRVASKDTDEIATRVEIVPVSACLPINEEFAGTFTKDLKEY